MEKVLFSEEQKFTQWYLYVFAIAGMFAFLIPFLNGVYEQVILEVPYGENPMSIGGLVVSGFFSVLIVVLVYFIIFRSSLKTKITAEGVWFSFPPLIRKWKIFSPGDIAKYEIVTYRYTRDLGGRGIRVTRKYGKTYTISGNVGLHLHLKSGKRVLIGTQKKQALEYAMQKLM